MRQINVGNGSDSEARFVRDEESAKLRHMLFLVIETFRDVQAIGERFQSEGRMLPPDVVYHASWIDEEKMRCFQIMEAPSEEALQPWMEKWKDLVEFEVVPVVNSSEFWSKLRSA
ncbi:MAG TPA: DUF3303 family protein [Candidatus Methylomirabilis sp.]|nr:DUF3303 family protein [Candidatus Methylomirabilis sp.]